MSFASMPLYTGDYLRDTRHLTPLRHGIYLLALMYCWDSQGPMPLDEQECAGVCNCRSADEIEAMRYILGRYFIKMDDGHYNKRMAEEVVKFSRLSDKFSEAGRRSAEVRRNKARAGRRAQTESKTNAIEGRLNLGSTEVQGGLEVGLTKAEPRSVSPSPSHSLSSTKEELPTSEVLGTQRKRSAPAKGSRLPEDWALSKSCGEWAMKETGFSADRVRVEAAKFSNHWWAESGAKASKRDWSAAWRTWVLKAMTMPQQAQPRHQSDVAGVTVPSGAAKSTAEYLARDTLTPDEIKAAAAKHREAIARVTGRVA